MWVGGWNKMVSHLLLTFNCVSSSVGEGMTVGEAPRLLIATLSKAVPTGDTAGLPYQSSSVLSWKFCVISQGCNTTKKDVVQHSVRRNSRLCQADDWGWWQVKEG